MLEIVYAENSEQFLWENSEQFYECSKHIRIYSKHDVQRESLLMYKRILSMQKNRFDYCEIQTWKSIQIWRLDLEKMISLGVLWEDSEQFFK